MSEYCKYYKVKEEISFDGGETWYNTSNYRKGELYETESTDCGYTMYRWVPVVGGTECSGTTKMSQEKQQQSTDAGTTWEDVVPLQTRPALPVVEYESADCGYAERWVTLPISEGFICDDCAGPTFHEKYLLTLSDSSKVSGYCNERTSIFIEEIQPYSATCVNAIVGNCATIIGVHAFYNCSGLTSVTISSNVTIIGYSAFEHCEKLTSVTIYAIVPPSTDGLIPPNLWGAFDDTNNCPIYVPSESVDAYKNASGWSKYASRIQAIP